MATCAWCGREMLQVSTCLVMAFHREGRAMRHLRYGDERGWGGRVTWRCDDCGVAPGGFHHPGCDVQECPACGGQMITCGCRFDEDGPCCDDGWDDDADDVELTS